MLQLDLISELMWWSCKEILFGSVLVVFGSEGIIYNVTYAVIVEIVIIVEDSKEWVFCVCRAW